MMAGQKRTGRPAALWTLWQELTVAGRCLFRRVLLEPERVLAAAEQLQAVLGEFIESLKHQRRQAVA